MDSNGLSIPQPSLPFPGAAVMQLIALIQQIEKIAKLLFKKVHWTSFSRLASAGTAKTPPVRMHARKKPSPKEKMALWSWTPGNVPAASYA